MFKYTFFRSYKGKIFLKGRRKSLSANDLHELELGCEDEEDYLSGDDQDTIQMGDEEDDSGSSDQEDGSSSEGEDDLLAEFTPAQISTILKSAAANSKRR